MPSEAINEAINEATRREWRELGFYYDRDDVQKIWRLVGSRSGLANFADALAKFAADPRNARQSEHEHFGPYFYLEVGSWPHAEITDHWVAGPLPSLERLSLNIRKLLSGVKPGQAVLLRSSFAPSSPYELRLEVTPDNFDPAKEDPRCW